jgi:long-subunit fatty acid transport protein
MKKLILASVLLGMSVALVSTAFGASGTSGAQFLKICVDGKAAALGGASAVSSGAGSLFLNPAGLAGVEGKEVKFSQVTWIEGINYSNISYAQASGSLVWGVGVNYLTVPAITKVDNQGNVLSDTYSPSDMAVNDGFGRKPEVHFQQS